METTKDTAGVIAPPPLIFLGGLIVGCLIGWFHHFAFLPKVVGYILGGSLIAAGLIIVLIAKVKMSKVDTNIEPWKPTTAILSDGIYAISRNPIYLAMIVMYLGAVFLLNSLWILPPLALVILIMHYGVILREEKYLEQKFGAEYLTYKEKVRRWI